MNSWAIIDTDDATVREKAKSGKNSAIQGKGTITTAINRYVRRSGAHKTYL